MLPSAPMTPSDVVVLVTSAESLAVGYPRSGEKGITRLIERSFSPADRERLDALSGGVVRAVSTLPCEGRFRPLFRAGYVVDGSPTPPLDGRYRIPG